MSAEVELGATIVRHEVDVLLAVPVDVTAYERAVGQHVPAVGPRLVENMSDQLRGKTLAFERGIDLGVQEGTRSTVVVVLDETGDLSIRRDLEPSLRDIVLNRHDMVSK